MGKALPQKGKKPKGLKRSSYRSQLCSSNRASTTHAFPLATDTGIGNTCIDIVLTARQPQPVRKASVSRGRIASTPGE